MTEQYKPNLGEPPDALAHRDAVHIAVAPMVAGEDLSPGDRVAFFNGDCTKAWLSPPGKAVGIVDPFRTGMIREGERFWLFLLPNTITNLRHVWTHPAFTPRPPDKETKNHE